MADLDAKTRAALERLEILAGIRGNQADRAVRLSELANLRSSVMQPILAAIESQSRTVIAREVDRTGGAIRDQLIKARQGADDAARKAAAAETRASDVSVRLDTEMAEAAALFDSIMRRSGRNERILEDFSTAVLAAMSDSFVQRVAFRKKDKRSSAAINQTVTLVANELEAIAAVADTLIAFLDDPEGSGIATLAYLVESYLTAAQVNSAIAGRETLIRAAIDRASPTSDFADGATHWTGDISGTPEAVAAPSVDWVFASRTAAISIPAGNSARIGTRGTIAVKDGDTIRITVRLKVAGTGLGTNALRLQIAWLDGAFSTASLTQTVQSETIAPTGVYQTFVYEGVAPADTFWARASVYFNGAALTGATGTLETVRIENVSAVAALSATIALNYYTKVATDSAIATGIETFDAEVEGGIRANVTTSRTALAGLNGAVARFSSLVSAGPSYNAAGIDAVAWDEDGDTGTAVRLLGDNVIVPGSLSAGSLVVTDGSGELLPNWNFANGDMRGWAQTSGATATVVAKEAGIDGLSTANSQYVLRLPAADSLRQIDNAQIACVPGQRLSVSFECACGGASSGAAAVLRVRFYDRAGTLLQTSNATATLNGSTWVTTTGTFVAPANTVYFIAMLRLTPPASFPIYATNVSVVRQRSGAVLITPNSITGAQLITTEALITASAQIGNAVITGAKIANATITNAQIGNTIQSSNYAAGSAGWIINKNGTAQFHNLIVRDSLVVGSVSDLSQNYQSGEFRWVTVGYTTRATIALGATEPTDLWSFHSSFQLRGYHEGDSPVISLTPYLRVYRRIAIDGVWGGWGTLKTWNATGGAGAWTQGNYFENIGGDYTDVEYKIATRAIEANGTIPGVNCFRRLALSARKIMR